jgi:hypothetical protein
LGRFLLSGKPGIETDKKYYERSQYVIEKKRWNFETNSKRTQNELRVDCTMRALNAEFELFGATRALAEVRGAGMQQGSKLPGWGSVRKYKNSGNEAKKYLKTKDITF